MAGIPAAHGSEVSDDNDFRKTEQMAVLSLLVVALLLCMTLGAQAAEPFSGLPVEIQLNGDSTEQFTVTIEGEAGAPMRNRRSFRFPGQHVGL